MRLGIEQQVQQPHQLFDDPATPPLAFDLDDPVQHLGAAQAPFEVDVIELRSSGVLNRQVEKFTRQCRKASRRPSA